MISLNVPQNPKSEIEISPSLKMGKDMSAVNLTCLYEYLNKSQWNISHFSVFLPVWLSLCLSVFLPVCLSVCFLVFVAFLCFLLICSLVCPYDWSVSLLICPSEWSVAESHEAWTNNAANLASYEGYTNRKTERQFERLKKTEEHEVERQKEVTKK